jgi:hypothetical protein
MSTTPSGTISVKNVETVLNEGLATNYLNANAKMTFNDVLVRTLAQKTTDKTKISMSDMRSKGGPQPYGSLVSQYCSGTTLKQTLNDGKYGTYLNDVPNSPSCTVSLTINSNTTDYVLNTAKISGYVAGQARVVLTIAQGVYVYSTSTSTPALTVTGFTVGDIITIVNNGFIVGMGGKGGYAGEPASGGYFSGNILSGSGGNGFSGGPALKTTFALTIINNGTIGGGGGGGGGSNGWSGGYQYSAGGSGGGGRVNGPAGDDYIYPVYAGGGTSLSGGNGTLYAPGPGVPAYYPAGRSGRGGDLGQAGTGGEGLTDGAGGGHTPSSGGAAGPAIVGNTLITYSVRGTILGAYT